MNTEERERALRAALASHGVDWETLWWLPLGDALRGDAVHIATNRLRTEDDPGLPERPWRLVLLTVWQRGLVIGVESAERPSIDATRFRLAGWT